MPPLGSVREGVFYGCLLAFVALPGCSTGNDEDQKAPSTTSGGEAGACYDDNPRANAGVPESSIQKTWGAACKTDADCVALLGDGGICAFDAVIFELPGGYCTKACTFPDAETKLIPDDPTCDPKGGVDCIGQLGQFVRCAVPCTQDEECGRDGYLCQPMPLIGSERSYCLMDECCEVDCAG